LRSSNRAADGRCAGAPSAFQSLSAAAGQAAAVSRPTPTPCSRTGLLPQPFRTLLAAPGKRPKTTSRSGPISRYLVAQEDRSFGVPSRRRHLGSTCVDAPIGSQPKPLTARCLARRALRRSVGLDSRDRLVFRRRSSSAHPIRPEGLVGLLLKVRVLVLRRPEGRPRTQTRDSHRAGHLCPKAPMPIRVCPFAEAKAHPPRRGSGSTAWTAESPRLRSKRNPRTPTQEAREIRSKA
jgi:hypothetical protein